jgi:hypothetical protein
MPRGAGAVIEFCGSFLFLLSVTGIGAIVDRVLCGKNNDSNSITTEEVESRPQLRFGWSFLLGAAVVGIALHVPLAIDGRITHLSFAIVVLAGLAAWGWFGVPWWRRERRVRLHGWMRDLPVVAQIALGIALFPAIVHSSLNELSGYDARTIYALKARMLYHTGTVRSEDFLDIDRVNFNPGYPLLLPLIEANLDWTRGMDAGPGTKLLFLGFALALVSIFAGQLRRFEAPGFAALSALLLLMTPMVACCFEGAGLSGSADLPFAAFLLGGVLELSRWLGRPSGPAAASAGLLFGAAALTKMEGVLWIAGCGAALVIVMLVRRKEIRCRPMLALPVIGTVALAIALGRLVHRGMPDSPYYPAYFAAIDWHWLRQLGDRPWVVLRYAADELVRLRCWNLIWPAAISSLVFLKRGRVPVPVWFWRLTAIGMAAAYFGVLLLTPLNLYYQLFTSTSRLLLHIYPLAVLIMSEQLAASAWSREIADVFRIEPQGDPAATVSLPMLEKEERKRAA